MTSTSVAQHTTQPLNFGPEWLRALSTPDSATSIPSSGGSSNVFKFSATKYRYSKDEILSLRANVSERLTEATQNEILENLRDVESVFRPSIVDPVALTAPTPEETAKMNALSSYISGRTPGGAGRTGNNSQQSQQDSRNIRGGGGSGGSMANGRGGSRGRGGRDTSFGLSRGNSNNNNSDDNGENGNTGDETSLSSSSWSRGSYHSRGGSFGSRGRSYDDRDQPQTTRRGIGTRQTSDGWRRSRGDDDDSHEQSEDSPTPVNGSASWTSRGGQTRRGGSSGSGSMEQRTKSNEKWSNNDDRPGPSNSFESNQQRGGSGWRTNSSMSDRDQNSRRAPTKRDRMPEWMDDDNNEDDRQLNNATFEKDGTFTRSSAVRDDNSNEHEEIQSRSASDESLSQSNTTPSRQEEESKPEKSISQTDTTAVHAPTVSKPIESQPTPPVQHSFPSWDDEFDHNDLATNVVESTLAEDPDYSPRIAPHSTSRLVSLETTPPTAPLVPQQRAPVIIDDKQWFYKDPQNTVQGPFSSADMERWFAAGYFTILLPVKRLGEAQFSTIQQLTKELGRLPFRTDVSSLPPTPVQKQQPIVPETQKFSPMDYMTSSTSNNTFIDDFLMQQQQLRQNPQHSMLYNKQTSMPSSTNDRKQVSSPSNMSPQLQAYFNSHSQSSSSLFPSNSVNDPAILYQQQLQRSMSSTNQQSSSSILYDDMQRSFRQLSSQSSPANNSSFFPSNLSMSQQQQQSNDIMSRLSQAMQSHGKQQDKVDDQHRREQQRHEREIERLKLIQQAERMRLQREEEERRKFEQQELRRKQEAANNRQINFDQLTKTIDTKNQLPIDTDQFLLFQQSVQYQKEQQAKLEAQQAENVRRYQQQYREQPQQSMYKLPETNNWTRHLSKTNDIAQSLNLAQIQKQEQEQERRSREAAAFAQQYAKSETLSIPNPCSPSSSSSTNKPNSWAQTLFAGSNNGPSHVPSTASHISLDHNTNENPLSESSGITSYNQQATNAPKSRSATSQQATPWNGGTNLSNTSLHDIQRQQTQNFSQNEVRQQSYQITSGHSSTSTPAWGSQFQQSTSSQQPASSSFWDNQQSSSSSNKSFASTSNTPSTPWTELKPTLPSTITSPKINPINPEPNKNEREVQGLFTTTRTQAALSKWTQTQFKDNLKDVDVPTLVQLLKDIDNAGEIMEYVQPYIGSVSKAKEFAHDFLVKRNLITNAEPDLDNERLNELAMAPTSSNDNSGSGGDEGFQLASSNGQKKKAKKIKGQKVDVKQLGFMLNNRPEQREDIEKVPM